MKHRLFKIIPLAAMLAVSPAFAEDGHNHAHEPAAAHGHSHDDGHAHGESHFKIEKPATVADAWAMLDAASADAQRAIEAKDAESLHESSEKMGAAVATLSENPNAVKEGNKERATTTLEQLSKTIDRFHHAAEDNNLAGASEALELLNGQKALVKSLYPKDTE